LIQIVKNLTQLFLHCHLIFKHIHHFIFIKRCYKLNHCYRNSHSKHNLWKSSDILFHKIKKWIIVSIENSTGSNECHTDTYYGLRNRILRFKYKVIDYLLHRNSVQCSYKEYRILCFRISVSSIINVKEWDIASHKN